MTCNNCRWAAGNSICSIRNFLHNLNANTWQATEKDCVNYNKWRLKALNDIKLTEKEMIAEAGKWIALKFPN